MQGIAIGGIEEFRIKTNLIKHLLYHKQYLCAFTEYWYADVFAVKRSFYCSEFEIKTNRADLMKELRVIQKIKDGDYGYSAKNRKHYNYLNNTFTNAIKPNEFSFAVGKELADIALEGIKDTPYGLLVINGNWWEYDYAKKPEKIHKKKYELNKDLGLIRKATTECQNLREKIMEFAEKVR